MTPHDNHKKAFVKQTVNLLHFIVCCSFCCSLHGVKAAKCIFLLFFFFLNQNDYLYALKFDPLFTTGNKLAFCYSSLYNKMFIFPQVGIAIFLHHIIYIYNIKTKELGIPQILV